MNVVSTARRSAQAAPAGALVYLIDARDARYDVSARGQAAFEKLHGTQPVLTTRLDPSGSFQATRVFEVPIDAAGLALGHRHGTGAWFPGRLIIGEGFRPSTVIQLPPAP